MSIVINNTRLTFPDGTALEKAYIHGVKIIDALAMVRNPYDFMQVKINQDESWEVMQ